MCTLAPYVPIVIYQYYKPEYLTHFGWDVDLINVIDFWRNRSHPFVNYSETEVPDLRLSEEKFLQVYF